MTELGLVFISVAIMAASQLLLSHGAKRTNKGGGRPLWREPRIWIALAMNGGAALLWLRALETLDLSYAFPFLALNYLLVPLLAGALFGEKIDRRRMAGIVVVCAGVLLSGMS